ncbi:nicotinamide phosphoribosyltransferase domain-containing protein [Pasteurella multocida]|nr:nicotinamide phosphoribosyltransferase domain-containing protein [Pasteurella multocida]
MYTSNFLNLILNTDSYKASHWLQYPPNTEYIFLTILKRVEKL